MSDPQTESPSSTRWLKKTLLLALVILIASVVALFLNLYAPNRPVDYADAVAQGKEA